MADESNTNNDAGSSGTGNSIERDDSRELSPILQTRLDELRSAIAEIDWNKDPKGHEEVISELKEVAEQNWYVAADVWRESAPDVPPPAFLDATRAEAFELRKDAAERGIYREEVGAEPVERDADSERRKKLDAERTHVEEREHTVMHVAEFVERAASNEQSARNPANDEDIGREAAMSESTLALLATRRRNDIAEARRALGFDAERDGDGPAPARATREAAPEPTRDASADAKSTRDAEREASADKSAKGAIPKTVANKFLQAENTYYFRDSENKVAFEDRGRKMLTAHNDPDVVGSMVEMAESKGWTKLRVTGHDDFKRQVWLEASLRGIDVTGYVPKDVDRAKLAELQADRRTNSISQETTREPERAAERPADERSRETAGEQAREAAEKGIAGVLLEHGPAPYMHDKDNSQSYFVKYRDSKGAEQTTWGVDLERAIGESGAKIGDTVKLENLGKQWVNVNVPVKDKDGKVVGTEPKEVHRNTWDVQVEGMKQVLKGKGYSDKTIDAAVKTANEQLSERAAAGKPIPTMRIHDAKAPPASRQRTVARAPQPSKEKEPAR